MVHVTRNMQCEIVIFGKTQKLLTPIVLGSGGPCSCSTPRTAIEKVQICKITARTLDTAGVKLNCPLDLAEIVRQMANIGSSYPDDRERAGNRERGRRTCRARSSGGCHPDPVPALWTRPSWPA